MDLMNRCGRIREHELKDRRPQEPERLAREGRVAQLETTPPAAGAMVVGRVIGGTAPVLGVVAIVPIMHGLLIG